MTPATRFRPLRMTERNSATEAAQRADYRHVHDSMPSRRLTSLTSRWRLLAALGLVLLLAGVSAGFGLHVLATATDSYASLIDTTISAAKQADDVNALFITRHKVLKDVYLYDTEQQRVDKAADEVAAYDQQIDLGLTQLQQSSALEPHEAQLLPRRGRFGEERGRTLRGSAGGCQSYLFEGSADLHRAERPVSSAQCPRPAK